MVSSFLCLEWPKQSLATILSLYDFCKDISPLRIILAFCLFWFLVVWYFFLICTLHLNFKERDRQKRRATNSGVVFAIFKIFFESINHEKRGRLQKKAGLVEWVSIALAIVRSIWWFQFSKIKLIYLFFIWDFAWWIMNRFSNSSSLD